MIPSTGASTRRLGRLHLLMARRPGARLVATAALIGVLALTACDPAVQVHGHMPDKDALSRITVGATSREEVRQLLGSPTSVGTFDDRRWYFITRKVETAAFDEKEVLEHEVVMIEFDEGGFVSSVEKQEGMGEVQEVALVDRVTPTKGRELGFFEQILGNFGGGRLTKKTPNEAPSPIGRSRN